MNKINFKSKIDNKEFIIEISKDLEGGFIKINNKIVSADEVDYDLYDLYDKVINSELVYTIAEIYDLYYFEGSFYDLYWDTASGCIFSKLTE